MPHFSLLGATPNLILIVSACWIAIGGQRQVMVLLPLAAIFYDLLTANPAGSSIIALSPLLLLSGTQLQDPSSGHLTPALLMVAAGTLVYHIIDGFIIIGLGEEVPWFRAATHSWLPEVLINCALT